MSIPFNSVVLNKQSNGDIVNQNVANEEDPLVSEEEINSWCSYLLKNDTNEENTHSIITENANCLSTLRDLDNQEKGPEENLNIIEKRHCGKRKKIEIDEMYHLFPVRQAMAEIYFKRARPCVKRIFNELNYSKKYTMAMLLSHDEIFDICINKLKLRYKIDNDKIYYCESNKVLEQANVYLQLIKEARESECPIYCLGSMMLRPYSKAPFVYHHIGSVNGFLSKLTPGVSSQSRKFNFLSWFEQALKLMTPGSVVIMNNNNFNTIISEELPTVDWSKASIQEWLTKHGIEFGLHEFKIELIERVRLQKKGLIKYKIDEAASKYNISILRAPKYYYELNPIMSIFEEIKPIMLKTLSKKNKRVVDTIFCLYIHNETKWKKAYKQIAIEEKKLDGLPLNMKMVFNGFNFPEYTKFIKKNTNYEIVTTSTHRHQDTEITENMFVNNSFANSINPCQDLVNTNVTNVQCNSLYKLVQEDKNNSNNHGKPTTSNYEDPLIAQNVESTEEILGF